jgi:hypothetical protein
LEYYGHQVCDEHYSRHCDDEDCFDLKPLFGIADEPPKAERKKEWEKRIAKGETMMNPVAEKGLALMIDRAEKRLEKGDVDAAMAVRQVVETAFRDARCVTAFAVQGIKVTTAHKDCVAAIVLGRLKARRGL